jgi:hypothetical protein
MKYSASVRKKKDSSPLVVRRAISLLLTCSAISLLLLVTSYLSEALLNRLLGMTGVDQSDLRDISALVALISLALTALLNRHARQGRDRES